MPVRAGAVSGNYFAKEQQRICTAARSAYPTWEVRFLKLTVGIFPSNSNRLFKHHRASYLKGRVESLSSLPKLGNETRTWTCMVISWI